MTHSSSFEVRTASCFFNKMITPQYEEFIEDIGSSRKALLTILLLYHMYEWANEGQRFTKCIFIRNYLDEQDLATVFDIARKIANGTKHFRIRNESQSIDTRVQSGFSSGFSDAFARRLIVIEDNGVEHSAFRLIKLMYEFWREQEKRGFS